MKDFDRKVSLYMVEQIQNDRGKIRAITEKGTNATIIVFLVWHI